MKMQLEKIKQLGELTVCTMFIKESYSMFKRFLTGFHDFSSFDNHHFQPLFTLYNGTVEGETP